MNQGEQGEEDTYINQGEYWRRRHIHELENREKGARTCIGQNWEEGDTYMHRGEQGEGGTMNQGEVGPDCEWGGGDRTMNWGGGGWPFTCMKSLSNVGTSFRSVYSPLPSSWCSFPTELWNMGSTGQLWVLGSTDSLSLSMAPLH